MNRNVLQHAERLAKEDLYMLCCRNAADVERHDAMRVKTNKEGMVIQSSHTTRDDRQHRL